MAAAEVVPLSSDVKLCAENETEEDDCNWIQLKRKRNELEAECKQIKDRVKEIETICNKGTSHMYQIDVEWNFLQQRWIEKEKQLTLAQARMQQKMNTMSDEDKKQTQKIPVTTNHYTTASKSGSRYHSCHDHRRTEVNHGYVTREELDERLQLMVQVIARCNQRLRDEMNTVARSWSCCDGLSGWNDL
jgi:hypothetical protein